MNVEQALNAADESDKEGLRGLYPTAAQVLAVEVRDLRKKAAMLRAALENMEEGYNPETPHMVKCWDAARRALSETEGFGA